MKPLFGVNLTEDKKNETVNIETFEVQTPSRVLKTAWETTLDEAERTNKRAELPGFFKFVRGISGFVAVLMISIIIAAILGPDGISLYQLHKNAGGLFVVAGGALILWGVLVLFSMARAKKVRESTETTFIDSKLQSTSEAIFREFGVPPEASDVDVLFYRYKVKKGIIKPVPYPVVNTAFMHLSVKLYVQEGNLCFVTLDGKYAIPLSSLRELRKIDKKISAMVWTKKEDYDSELYKTYKIKCHNDIVYSYKPFYELTFSLNDSYWTVEFPPYELEEVEAVTGLKAK